MKGFLYLLGFLLGLWVLPAAAQAPITFAWDPGVVDTLHSAPTGFVIMAGPASGMYTNFITVPVVCPGVAGDPAGCIGTAVLPAGTFVAVAGIAGALQGPPSNEVQVPLASDPSCAPPFGSNAIAIFPTALQKTGSGGPGSRARLDFQVASPGSPVTHISIQSGGVDIAADGVVDGVSLAGLAGLWFTIPAGNFPLSIRAVNAARCVQVQSTPYTLGVP